MGNLRGLKNLSRNFVGEHLRQHVEDSVMYEGRSIKRSTLVGRYPDALCQKLADLVLMAQTTAHSARHRRASPSAR